MSYATPLPADLTPTRTVPAETPATQPPGAETLSRIRLLGLLDQLLEEGLAIELRVTGSSMSPFLRSGDLVTLVPVKNRPVAPGDIVAFLAQGRWLVIHRTVEATAETLRTRGDSLRRGDEPVRRGDLLALVSAIERDGRPRRLGLGRERIVIAWLSRHGWLAPLLSPLRWLTRLLHDR